MISHIRAQTTLGQVMRTNIDWIQLISGHQKSIFTTRQPLHYMDQNWFLNIREFLIQSNSSITIEQVWTPISGREKDRFIMDEFNKLSLSIRKMQILNNWRLYFQIIHLSDMTNT